MTNVFTEINEQNFKGTIESGKDLIVVEMEDVLTGTFDSAMVLNGFDEMYSIDVFENPVFGFLS